MIIVNARNLHRNLFKTKPILNPMLLEASTGCAYIGDENALPPLSTMWFLR